MKLIDKQIVRELTGPFVFGVMAFSSVFFAGTYLLKLTTWVMDGMPLVTAVEAVMLLLPPVLFYTLPMAILLAVLLGMGRLSGDSEIVALFAGGVSLYRVAIPVIVLGVLVSVSAIVLDEAVAPLAKARYDQIEAAMLKQIAPQDQPFTVKDDATDSRVDVNGGMDVDTGILKSVTVTRFVNKHPYMIILRVARSLGGNDRSGCEIPLEALRRLVAAPG